ncbi:hypothetical protein PCASD_21773 [Puccinia coronata f. sp. avenae]|uniref:Uncharacterized protein n=1 Tax=Puccinia coronata f. sp. avenae TaxID=200324 RepID=A0A2N5SQT0_9BASI|nr:hypothetical protein PCASD_21773 [Puccinia coronata f. sp. avenae]
MVANGRHAARSLCRIIRPRTQERVHGYETDSSASVMHPISVPTILALPINCALFLTLVAWAKSPYFHLSSQDRERMLLLHLPKALRPSIDHIVFLHLVARPESIKP